MNLDLEDQIIETYNKNLSASEALDVCQETNKNVTKKRSSSKVCFWFPLFDSLIPMIKTYPVIYRNDMPLTRKLYKSALDTAWNEIATKLELGKRSCMHHWKIIKFTYAKLKMLCKSGNVTEEDVKLHKHTTRYFDGTLSFLDPHIGEITEANIPPSIHKQINKIFSFKIPQCLYYEEPKPSPFLTHEDIIKAIEKRPKEKEVLDEEDEQRLYNLVENVVKHKLNELFPQSINSVPDSQTPNKEIQLQLHSELIIEDHNIKMEETDHTIENDFVIMEIDESNSKKMPNNEIIGEARVEDNNLFSGDVHDNMMITANQTEISNNMGSEISVINIVGGNVNTITEKKPVISCNMTSSINEIDFVVDVNSMITEEKRVINSNMTSSIIDINSVGCDVNTMITEDMITEEKPVISNNMTDKISDIALVGADINTKITEKIPVISSNMTSSIIDMNSVGCDVNTMTTEDMITEEKPVISNNMTDKISNIALVGADINTKISEKNPVISSNMTSSIIDINSVGCDVNTMITEDMITEEKPVITNNMTDKINDIALVSADINTKITEKNPVISSNMTSSMSAINSVDDVNTMITKEKPVISSNMTSRISDTNMKKFFSELGEVMSIELPKEKQVLLKGQINTLLRNISEEE